MEIRHTSMGDQSGPKDPVRDAREVAEAGWWTATSRTGEALADIVPAAATEAAASTTLRPRANFR